MDTNVYADRRRSPRIPIAARVQMQSIDYMDDPDEESLAVNPGGLSHDVSEGGMCLFTQKAYPIDGRLLLTFEYMEMGCLSITSREGSVVWSRPSGDDSRYMLGIRFCGIH